MYALLYIILTVNTSFRFKLNPHEIVQSSQNFFG